ncbi:hypothetical protein SPRG_11141 [Saprolegnia parasitica CBS 223.65]|uniref:Uncharacterized protein n=1 Tax=Saprolegnia parasitica (strain CBS 223.65) TaxID=695850 RepID=A0A067BZM0_SAPPC|nr:hypothetical protein SPRG_11141 [Saprolegnia parasitica CBS 223.65]KDO23693.1 hypothetical protein SPRG_11141 [Saprolegnia parasitica CBS 223.65]|eukprot:XP_012205676.1 hypothetical protein SPRG_11141 [Saprolegnia parasitica CBS 223.65]
MHLEAKSECPHWIYEMLPLSPTDGVPYEELKTYLLRRRDEPVAGMALDIPRYKIIVLPPGGEARLLGYIGHNLIAVIRRNKLKK